MAVLALLAASCARPPSRPFETIAILRFDDLSGNANQAWISTAAAAILTGELTGAPHTVAVSVASLSDAYLAGATRVVHGYFDGPTSFHVAVEDLASHKMVATEDLQTNLLAAMDRASHLINPQALPFSTSQEESVEAWGKGNYEEAVRRDPSFSAAWLSWVQQLAAQRNTSKALEVASQALSVQPALRSPIDRAQIELMAASLRDDQPARLKALDTLAHLDSLDVQLWRTLAETQTNARNFPKAVEAYRQAIQLAPQNAELRNLLGYAQALSGDMEAAKTTFTEYGKLPGQAVNSFDSLGEAYFLNGKFAEAGESFLAAYKLNPMFLGGADLPKAAYAKWFGGHQDDADQTMKQFLIGRVKLHDSLTEWREAAWLYATGREAQAVSSLERAMRDELPAQARDLVGKQLALWKDPSAIPHDLETLKQMYERTPPTQDGLVRTLYARALLRAGEKDEAHKLVALWRLPESGGDPLLQSVVYPTFLEVRKAVQ